MARKRRHYESVAKPGQGARVALYLRYSNPKQNGTTMEKQRRLLQEMVEVEHWQVVAEYLEPKTSAKNDTIASRPQFAALLAAAERHDFDVVLVECIDRWGREPGVYFSSLNILENANVYWSTVVAPVYNSLTIKQEGTDIGFGVGVTMAASSTRITSRKVVDGMLTQNLKGYHHSALPFGYRRSEPELDEAGRVKRRLMVADPETFPVLATIADLRIKGWGSKQIAEAVGLLPSRILHILANETYVEFHPGTGRGTVITADGLRVEGLHPAAWSQETWQRMRQITVTLYGKPRAAAHWHRAYPLGGLIRCVDCGQRMISRTKHKEEKTYRYYDCYDHDRARCPAKKTAIPCHVAEDAFATLLVRLTERGEWQQALAQYLEDDPMPATAHALQRETLLRHMAALDAKLDMGRITPDAYRHAMRDAQRDMAALPPDGTDRREAALSGAARIIDVATGWHHATPAQRQEMATLLIQPLGLAWHHERRAFIAIRPHAEFVPGFAVALEWEAQGEWLVTPGQRWQPENTRGMVS